MDWTELYIGPAPFIGFEESRQGSPEIVCTRFQYRRNLTHFPFVCSATDGQLVEIREKISAIIPTEKIYTREQKMEEFSAEDRLMLSERMIWPHPVGKNSPFVVHPGSKLYADETGKTWVAVGLTEHFAFDKIAPGLPDPDDWFSEFGPEQDILARETWSYTPEMGYLTSDPRSVGTGFHVTSLLHLPGMFISRNHEKFFKAAAAMGLTGFSPGDLAGRGHLIFASHKQTLGMSAEEIYGSFRRITQSLLETEKQLQQKLYSRDKVRIEDKIFRAWQTLLGARLLSFGEYLELSSWSKLGVYLGLIPKSHLEMLYVLTLKSAPGHIGLGEQPGSPSHHLDEMRATMVRLSLLHPPESSGAEENF